MSYEKARNHGGTREYDILVRSADKGASTVANQFGLYGGSIMNRNMIVKCKKAKPLLVVDPGK